MTRRCMNCAKVKALENFSNDNRYPNGRRYECRDCYNARRRKRRNINHREFLPHQHKELSERGESRCYVCKQIKPFSEFYRLKTSVTGYMRRCKECDKKHHKKYFRTEKGKISAYKAIKKWEAKNPDKVEEYRKLRQERRKEQGKARRTHKQTQLHCEKVFKKKTLKSNGRKQGKNRNKEVIKLLKSNGCINCGYDKACWSLIFHHVDPSEKEFNLSSGKDKTLNQLMREVSKCVLVCANCHGEIHEGTIDGSLFPRATEIAN